MKSRIRALLKSVDWAEKAKNFGIFMLTACSMVVYVFGELIQWAVKTAATALIWFVVFATGIALTFPLFVRAYGIGSFGG